MLKDPEIKLFGWKISLPEKGVAIAGAERFGEWSNESSNGSGDHDCCSEDNRGEEVVREENLVHKEEVELSIFFFQFSHTTRSGRVSSEDNRGEEVVREENLVHKEEEQAEGEGEVCETTGEDEVCETTGEDEVEDPEDSGNTIAVSVSGESPKIPPTDDDVVSGDHRKTDNGGTDSQQKTLKKPDKILPCPRCKSMETKFCYYNNYNVNQPRHFCKSCQRYWTAGGTMRNVPVGAGRRKNKNSASHCHHITISEALQAARVDAPNVGFRNLKLKPNVTVLSFGPDSPLSESMASALHLAEKRVPNQGSSVSSKNGAKVDDSSPGASDGGGNGFQQPAIQLMTGFPPPVPCIPGVPWPFPWNSVLPFPAIFPPGYPLPYYTAPVWNSPWLSVPSPTRNQTTAAASGPSSPLGKHSRNGELLNSNTPKSSESSILVPKTLRIDDPEEAAKSSIWSTLGIKYSSISREGLFKALHPKNDGKQATATTSPLLQANPAAFSRSLKFQETA